LESSRINLRREKAGEGNRVDARLHCRPILQH
jgi:hypothetical protein